MYIIPFFYKDHKIHHWKEYLLQLFSFFEASLKNKYIKLDDSDSPISMSVHSFFGQYTIDLNADDLKHLWHNDKGMVYLRDHFLIRVSEKIYLLLNANLLVDKMYQGMKFDFFRSVNTYTKDGCPYSDYPHFNSVLGEVFSEPKMLYPLLHKCFDSVADKLIAGDKFKTDGIVGEPDFYMREGDTLFLFEYKDLTLGDKVKFSQNEEIMKQEILERICYDGLNSKGENKCKGGGQLLATIDKLLNKHSFDQYDNEVNHIKEIFPLIVTTDSAFSALGVNALVIEAFDEIRRRKGYIFEKVLIYVPIVVDFDTLIKLSYMLSIEKYSLKDIALSYLKWNEYNISPFSTFVMDNVLRHHKITSEENIFLFAEMFE